MAPVSPTLGIDERVHALRAEGRRIDHFGFGESPFPVPERLARHRTRRGNGHFGGHRHLRATILRPPCPDDLLQNYLR